MKITTPYKEIFLTPPLYKTRLKIPINCINYGNHLGHDSLISLTHQARINWLSSLEQSEKDFFGDGLILGELHAKYLNEAYLNDELEIKIFAETNSQVSFNLYYEVLNLKQHNLTAYAFTRLITFDYENKKVVKLSKKITDLLNT